MSTVHPFERAKLGLAPFRCTRVTVEKYQACHGAPIQPGTSCDFCGTGIMYAYWIKGSDERPEFKVGCDCVARTGAVVERFDVERKKLAREQSAARSHAKREARKAQWEAERAERQKQFAIEREQRFNAFAVAEPAVVSYLLNRTEGFLGEMNGALVRWGSLTDGQLKAVKSSMAREALSQSSRHVGEIGKRIDGTYTITKRTERDYGFPAGVRYWHLLTGADGNLYTYFGTCLGRTGEIISMRATVKDHETFNGACQTKLARPSNVTTVSEAPK
jgi:hypothetical protein